MPHVSIYWLNTYTGKDPRTIKKRLADLPTNSKGKFDSASALEKIYCGSFTELDGEFVSTAEAVRRLTIAKEKEIELNMEIKRGARIPIEDVREIVNRAFMSVAATLKANRDKVLTESQINEMFTMLRDSEDKLTSKNGRQHK